MAVASLRHIGIEVTDIRPAREFYDRFLGRLGFRRFIAEADYAGYAGGGLSVWIVANTHPRVRRRQPTGDEEVIADHLAFWVPSRDDVRRLQDDLAREEIYPIFRAAEHPEFRPGYFSAAWTDPDESVLEVYTFPKRRSRPRSKRTRGRRRRKARES